MARKLYAVLCSVVVLLLLASCAGTKALSPTSDASSAVYQGLRGEKPVYTFSVLDEKLQNPDGVYTIPWNENAVELAKQTNTIRYYFMSGEKQSFSSSSGIKLGDSCLIVFPDGTTMLVDAGMADYAATLVKNLELLGVEKLDYVVLSHMHNDHYGALWSSDGVLYKYPVGEFLWTGAYNDSESTVQRFYSTINARNIKTRTVQKGDKLEIGEVLIEFFAPVTSEVEGRYLIETALNNASLVMKITFGEFRALFSGDLYVDGEYKVLSENPEGTFDVELIKANHHGRDTSNSKEWGAATTPRVVVATAGNPPDTTPYGWYSKLGARVFGDYIDGYVRVVSDGYNCEVTTSKTRETTLYDNFDKIADQVSQQL